MAENMNIQTGIYNYLSSHAELKGKGEEVILSAIREAGFTEEEISAAQNTISAFGSGYSQVGDMGLSVESSDETTEEIRDGVKKFVDEDGNDVTLTLENGYPTQKTVRKNGNVIAEYNYTYNDDLCIVTTKNSDGSETSVICNDVDENGNVPDENFMYSQTKTPDNKIILLLMTPMGLTQKEISGDIQKTTVYSTLNYSDIQEGNADIVSVEEFNARGNGVITYYENGEEIGKYARVMLLKDESLSELARQYGTTVERIKELNPEITDANKVKFGTPIILENKSNVPKETTLERATQDQIELEVFKEAYQNIIEKQTKQETVTFPLEFNGKTINKFRKIEDAARYVLSLKNIQNPTKEEIDECAKELIILNSTTNEKSINKRTRSALDNINAGNLTYAGTFDYVEALTKWGLEPSEENYELYQKIYSTLDYLQNEYDTKMTDESLEILNKFKNIIMQKRFPDGAWIISETNESTWVHPNNLVTYDGTPDDLKYNMLMHCGINLYEDERSEEVKEMLRRKAAITLYSNISEYIYQCCYNTYDDNNVFRDFTNVLDDGTDFVFNLFGGDYTRGVEVTEYWKRRSKIADECSRLKIYKADERTFNEIFTKIFGVEYNENTLLSDFGAIDDLLFDYEAIAGYFERNGIKDYLPKILNDETFQLHYYHAFHDDLKSILDNLELNNTIANLGNIELMVLAFKGIGESAAIKSLSAGAAINLSKIGMQGKWLQTTQASIVGGATFATYTAAEGLSRALLKGETINVDNLGKISQDVLESFGFGAFAGAFNVLASYGYNAVKSAPIFQRKAVQQAVSTVEKSMAKGAEKSGAELMEMFYGAEESLISKGAHALYTFGANVVGFTTYNTAKDMIENMDAVNEMGFGNYLSQQFLAQLEGLATFEGVKMLLEFAMSGKIGATSAMSVKDCLKNFDILKNVTVKPIDYNGKTAFSVKYLDGEPVILNSLDEAIGLCQKWMVTELNFKMAYPSETPLDATGEVAFTAPEPAKAEDITTGLLFTSGGRTSNTKAAFSQTTKGKTSNRETSVTEDTELKTDDETKAAGKTKHKARVKHKKRPYVTPKVGSEKVQAEEDLTLNTDIISDKYGSKSDEIIASLKEFRNQLRQKLKSFIDKITGNTRDTGKPNYDNPELNKYKLKDTETLEHADFYMNNYELFTGTHDYDCWAGQSSSDPKHGAWKMHLYSVSEADWQKMSQVIIPYLRDHDIDWKTFNINHTVDNINGGNQRGKAFTIYPRDNNHFAQIAKDLDYIIRMNNLQTEDSQITGDRNLGETGRLFYRYEFSSNKYQYDILDMSNPNEYRKYMQIYDSNQSRIVRNGHGNYLADDMTINDDPFYSFDPADLSSRPAEPPKAPVQMQRGSYYEANANSVLILANSVRFDLSRPDIRNLLDSMPEGSSITVGRSSDCNIRIDNEYLSRYHIVITKYNGKIYIQDNSTNGTIMM